MPHSDKTLGEAQFADLVDRSPESFTPAAQGLGIVRSEIFEVQYSHVGRPGNRLSHRQYGGQAAAGKDIALNEIG